VFKDEGYIFVTIKNRLFLRGMFGKSKESDGGNRGKGKLSAYVMVASDVFTSHYQNDV
jgi:hypothetical protein